MLRSYCWPTGENRGLPKNDHEVAQHMGVCTTVETARKRCVLEGLEAASERRKRDPRPLDGVGEAQLIAIACSEPAVESISHEAVRKVLRTNR